MNGSMTENRGTARQFDEYAPQPRPVPRLTRREIEVLRAWIKADSKKEAAALLYISLGTMNTHLARVREKYEAVGRPAPTKAGLVARALQDGWIALDEL